MSNQFDFSQGPKKVWAERFTSAYNGPLVQVALTSGAESSVFIFDVTLAKKMSRALLQAVENFEKVTGQKVDDRFDNDPLPSPLSGEMKPPEDGKKSK